MDRIFGQADLPFIGANISSGKRKRMVFNIHANLDSSLTGSQNMGTTNSPYTFGRFQLKQGQDETVSLVPKAPTPSGKPETLPSARSAVPLSQRSMQVLAALPTAYQMIETRKLYPHVLNRISEAFYDPEFFAHVVRNFLIDQRGGRNGFPFTVLAEITNLREFYFSVLHPEVQDRFDRDI